MNGKIKVAIITSAASVVVAIIGTLGVISSFSNKNINTINFVNGEALPELNISSNDEESVTDVPTVTATFQDRELGKTTETATAMRVRDKIALEGFYTKSNITAINYKISNGQWITILTPTGDAVISLDGNFTPGVCTLSVQAIAPPETGKIKSYYFELIDTRPKISVIPEEGTDIDEVIINIDAPNGLDHAKYQWNDDDPIKFYSTTQKVEVPTKKGEHFLYVYVYDKEGVYSTGTVSSEGTNNNVWVKYKFMSTGKEANRPIIDVIPSDGDNITDVTIIITAPNGLDHAKYQWDSNESIRFVSETLTIPLPSGAGTHNLYIYACDKEGIFSKGTIASPDSTIQCWQKYTFSN